MRGTQRQVFNEVGVHLCEAVLLFEAGDYGACVDRLRLVHSKIHKVGASNAQV